jgi:hypothetical protein
VTGVYPIEQPKPLKCGKYEEHTGNVCTVTTGDPNVICGDRCRPKMHSVTEKEYQELLARIRALEAKTASH